MFILSVTGTTTAVIGNTTIKSPTTTTTTAATTTTTKRSTTKTNTINSDTTNINKSVNNNIVTVNTDYVEQTLMSTDKCESGHKCQRTPLSRVIHDTGSDQSEQQPDVDNIRLGLSNVSELHAIL